MLDFTKIKFSDAVISAVRVSQASVEVDYLDWQGRRRVLVFDNVIGCCMFSPYGRALSHGVVEANSDYIRECCGAAEADVVGRFVAFNFIDAWNDSKILRIVAETVREGY